MKKAIRVCGGVLLSLVVLESAAEVIFSDDFSYGFGDRAAITEGSGINGTTDQSGNGTYAGVSGLGQARFGGDGYAYASYGSLGAVLTTDLSQHTGEIIASIDFTAHQQMLDGGSVDNGALYISGYPVQPWSTDQIETNFYIGARVDFNDGTPANTTLKLVASAGTTSGLQRNESSAAFGANYDATDTLRLSVIWDPSTGEISASAYNVTDDETYSVTASDLNPGFFGLGNFDTVGFCASGLDSAAITNYTTFDNLSVVTAVPDFISDDFSFGSGDRADLVDGDDLNDVEVQSGGAVWNYRAASSKMVFRSPGAMGAANTQGNSGAYIPYDFDQIAASNTVVMEASFIAGDQMLYGGSVNNMLLSFTGDASDLALSSTDIDQITLRFAPSQTVPANTALQLYCNVVASNDVERLLSSSNFSNYSFGDQIDLCLEWSIDTGEVTATASNTVTGFSQTLSLQVPLNPDDFSRSLFNALTVQATGLDGTGAYADMLIDDFRVDFLTAEPILSRIVDLVVVSADQLKLLVSLPNDSSQYSLVGRDDLSSGTWSAVAHSDDGVNAYVMTNLSYSTVEGINFAVYVSATNQVGFFGVE